MTNATKDLKHRHRRHGEGLSLKAFARDRAKNGLTEKEQKLALGWLVRKKRA